MIFARTLAIISRSPGINGERSTSRFILVLFNYGLHFMISELAKHATNN